MKLFQMKKYFLPLLLISFIACKSDPPSEPKTDKLNEIATSYVRLGLEIGQYDSDFVDAYYGPDSLKPTGEKLAVFPKDSFLTTADKLIEELNDYIKQNTDPGLDNRAAWISGQLTAFKRRIRIFSGEFASFDQEAKELFGAQPPAFTEEYFQNIVKELDGSLPGKGSIKERFQAFSGKFIIPKDKLDTVYKTSIAESRKLTLQHYKLPPTENFKLEFVTDKPWSGYNWYQGKYSSIIQFNTDINANIEKAIDIAAHEGYPGHHVYNTLLEQKLYNEKGWIEISLYPLFSPQSLIAEGSANFGIDVVFPGNERILFAKNVLMPLAGLDTAGIELYFKILELKSKLSYADIEVTRRLIDGKMNDAEAIRWMKEYIFADDKTAARSLSFKKKYRTYIMNYTFGQDLVREYINHKGGTDSDPAKRWELFEWLLSNEVLTADLMVKK